MSDQLIPWWWTQLDEAEVEGVAKSIRNGHINQGPVCHELEKRLAEQLDLDFVILTTSGSAALVLAMIACGVRPGDEVIVPAITFIATAHAAMLLGASVRIADVRPDRPVIDVDQIERCLTERTRVIVPVHMNGAACDIASIRDLAADRNLKVIEDSAQAFGSRNSHGWLGTQADIGTFSMSLAKLISTGEGGFLAVRDPDLDRQLRRLRNQGVVNIADNVFDAFGFNFRFNDMQAGVGLAQLAKLPQKIEAVRHVYTHYSQALSGLHYLRVFDCDLAQGELPLWTHAFCAERDKVVELLGQRGIQARPYHPSLSDSPHIKAQGPFPMAEAFAKTVLTLPCGPNQSEENLARTVDELHSISADIRTEVDSCAPLCWIS